MRENPAPPRPVQVDLVASCKVPRAFAKPLETILLDVAVAMDSDPEHRSFL